MSIIRSGNEELLIDTNLSGGQNLCFTNGHIPPVSLMRELTLVVVIPNRYSAIKQSAKHIDRKMIK